MKNSTIIDILDRARISVSAGVTFIERSNQEKFLSYQELYDQALLVLGFLQHKGMQPKDELVFQIGSNENFVITFWACILGGIIPVPLSIGQNHDHKQKLFKVWSVLHHPYLITTTDVYTKLTLFAEQEGLEVRITPESNLLIDEIEALSWKSKGKLYQVKAEETAFVQFSSGSTGQPKGVVLTHKNLLANLEAISIAGAYCTEDSMFSWMPLTHDMGLIGFHLNPIYSQMNHFLMPTNLFVLRPGLWLEKVSEHRASILCSPNFGYNYVLKHGNRKEGYELDLSHVRLIYNGAEPISENLCREFLNSLSQFGLRHSAMCPVYGLAEASLAVSIPELGNQVISLTVDRNQLKPGCRIVAAMTEKDEVSFVNVGKPIRYCSVKITGDNGEDLPEEFAGHIQIRGENVTSGYYNNPVDTAQVLAPDYWLKTGDVGFFKEGSLYIIGRSKDIIFANGQNYFPHDLERLAEEIKGVELNKVAIAGFFNEQSQKEEAIAFTYYRGKPENFLPIAKLLKSHINFKAGLELCKIIPVKDIPRTTSGKLQRFKLVEQFKAGYFDDTLNDLRRIARESVSADDLVSDFASTEPLRTHEEKLLKIWSEILGQELTDVNKNFFEIGGNSLKAAETGMQILKVFGAELPLIVLYENPTIRELAGILGAFDQQEYMPIPVVAPAEIYPLSSAQRGIYKYWELNKSSVAYNIPVVFSLKGEIRPAQLNAGIQKLIARHDALRMSFVTGVNPGFRISPELDFQVTVVECMESELSAVLQSLVMPFDLGKGPLFNISLILKDQKDYLLFLDFHHIISDGVSIYNFLTELLSLYHGDLLTEQRVEYKDFSVWETGFLNTEKIAAQENYWKKELQGGVPVLEMPVDFTRPVIFNTKGARIGFDLSKEMLEKLKELANTCQSTVHVLLFTIYNVLLSKYTGQQEIMTGIPVAGRKHPDLQQLQGMFVNNLAIKSNIEGEQSFVDLLQLQKQKIEKALANQHYPFDELVKNLGLKRDITRNPLFDTMFIYQNMGIPKYKNSEFTLSGLFFDPGFSKFDFSLEIFEYQESMSFAIEYATSLFKKQTIVSLVKHFKHLTRQIIACPEIKISGLLLADQVDYEQQICHFNDTRQVYPHDQRIHKLFEQQVLLNPGHTAVECDEVKFTYQQLNDQANLLANVLLEKKNRIGIVAVVMERSPELIVSILGILKAGGTYLPLDADLPEERLQYIIGHSRSETIITSSDLIYKTAGLVHVTPGQHIHIIDISEVLENENINVVNPIVYDNPTASAYVIYTSGTTGKPKGVEIGHRALVNYISWAAKSYVGDKAADFPLFTSISFDLTITSIFTPLITGNKIVIYKEDGQQVMLEKVIADNKVDILKLTPSHLKILVKSIGLPNDTRIKRLIVGGEELESEVARNIYDKFQGNVEIFNEYGPTEATVGCMIHQFHYMEEYRAVPIGIPAANTRIYILDQYLKPLPQNIIGEIYIAGDGLAKGYLFDEQLTHEKFIEDPFHPGQFMYKTGDLGKHLADCGIEFTGRADQQVKINGYRIELAEIESQIKNYPGIAEVLVSIKNNKKEQKMLCAYYTTAHQETSIAAGSLRKYLILRLPHYMIPVHFTEIEYIPLTKNGKVDTAALPEPVTVSSVAGDLLPASRAEEFLLAIWKEVLGETDIKITDNFFELGGDSIKAVQIVSRLSANGIFLQVKDILSYQTIEQISWYAQLKDTIFQYEQGIMEGHKNNTPIESWFFNQNFVNPDYYNQSVLLHIHKKINVDLLEQVFQRLIEHHDGLRINYNPDNNTLFYNNEHLKKEFVIAQYDLRTADSTLIEFLNQVKGSLNLRDGLLLKAVIIQTGDIDKLFITAHHLVMDGISWRILLEDLYTLCVNYLEGDITSALPDKTASLIDWQQQLVNYSASEEVRSQVDFWKSAAKTVFTVPQDFVTDDWKAGNLNRMSGTLESEATSFLLKEAHQVYKTDVLILLNTALARTLKEWTGSSVMVIETENHGRHLVTADTSRTIGWFTAMYPVKLELKEEIIGQQIKAIKEQLRQIPDHGMGYGVSKYLNQFKEDEAKRTEIRFNYLGQFDKEFNNEIFLFSNESAGADTDPENTITTKLELNLMVIEGILNLEINYNTEAWKVSTIQWFSDTFFNHLKIILDHIKNEEDLHFTPSDFTMADLDQQELDDLFL